MSSLLLSRCPWVYQITTPFNKKLACLIKLYLYWCTKQPNFLLHGEVTFQGSGLLLIKELHGLTNQDGTPLCTQKVTKTASFKTKCFTAKLVANSVLSDWAISESLR